MPKSKGRRRAPLQIETERSPSGLIDLKQLELLGLEKEMGEMETRLLLMRRRLRAIITGDRKGNAPKVVTITKRNGKTREIKCGTLGD